MNKGITLAGNIIVDVIKMIDSYPKCGMLATISGRKNCVGGCVPNTSIDLAILDKRIPIKAIGNIGNDIYGEYVVSEMQKFGVDTSAVNKVEGETSATDVMTIIESGERTFFQNCGVNKLFGIESIDIDKLDCDIFHIGYLLLLEKLDGDDEEYGTVMARLLSKIQSKGIKTSIDVVSDISGRFAHVVKPALKYCDYVILNEIESGMVANIKARNDDGTLNYNNMVAIAQKFLSYGVNEKVVIHCPEVGLCMAKNGKATIVPSLELPKGYIKGSVGAGDAFCAGMLYSFYKGLSDQKALEIASLCSACNLAESDSISGMRSIDKVMELEKLFPRRKLAR